MAIKPDEIIKSDDDVDLTSSTLQGTRKVFGFLHLHRN